MIFNQFKQFRDRKSDINEVIEYLKVDMTRNFRELVVGLSNLKFTENFNSFEVEVTIDSGAELEIRNALGGNQVPTKRIIVKGSDGSQNIVDGDTEWNQNFVYLKNTGASSATATVIFFR